MNYTIPKGNRMSLGTFSSDKWRPIRITTNYDYFEGIAADTERCTKIGQIVHDSANNGAALTCTEADLLTPERIKVVKITTQNVINFLSNLLKVRTYLRNIQIDDLEGLVNKNNENTDLLMVFHSRLSNTFIASAYGDRYELEYYRPIRGVVNINPKYIPKAAQNYNDTDNNYFNVILHEITHAFGFNSYVFRQFHSYDDSTFYKDPICNITKFGRGFSFLVTPYAHIFAKKRFGLDKFVGDDGKSCPSGIELEDGGGVGTAGSHLESRTYESEYMVGSDTGQPTPYLRLTDATLAVLMDSGNYKVNWAKAVPLVFGHPESINGKPIENFALNPPEIVLPSNYIANDDADFEFMDLTGFDYKHLGIGGWFNDSSVNCSESYFGQYCKLKDTYYNPKHKKTIGTQLADFQAYPSPVKVCPKGQAILPGIITKNPCGEYKCNGYERFEIKVNDEIDGIKTIVCTKENVGKYFNFSALFDGQIRTKRASCPDPERFCRTMKLTEMNFNKDPLDPKTLVLEGEPQAPPEWSFDYSDVDDEIKESKRTLIIIISVVCVVIVIIIASIIACCVCCIRKKKKSEISETPIEELNERLA